MSTPTFRQFCITIPAVVDKDDENIILEESYNWYGIEEYRVKSWGTTCHFVDGSRTENKSE